MLEIPALVFSVLSNVTIGKWFSGFLMNFHASATFNFSLYSFWNSQNKKNNIIEDKSNPP